MLTQFTAEHRSSSGKRHKRSEITPANDRWHQVCQSASRNRRPCPKRRIQTPSVRQPRLFSLQHPDRLPLQFCLETDMRLPLLPQFFRRASQTRPRHHPTFKHSRLPLRLSWSHHQLPHLHRRHTRYQMALSRPPLTLHLTSILPNVHQPVSFQSIHARNATCPKTDSTPATTPPSYSH